MGVLGFIPGVGSFPAIPPKESGGSNVQVSGIYQSPLCGEVVGGVHPEEGVLCPCEVNSFVWGAKSALCRGPGGNNEFPYWSLLTV